MQNVTDSIDFSLLEAIATLAWLLLTCAAGIVLLRAVGEPQIVVLVPMGMAIGVLAWLFCTNLLGRVLDIGTAGLFSTMLVVAIAAGAGWYRRRLLPELTTGVSKRVVVGLVLASVIFAATSFSTTWRMLMYDDREPSHITSALSMVYTEYPPLEPERPTGQFNYHYAPETFSAALLDGFGVPVWRGYDLQIGFFSLLVIPLSFGLVLVTAQRLGSPRASTYALACGVMIPLGTGWGWMDFFRDDAFRRAIGSMLYRPGPAVADLVDSLLSNFAPGRGTTLGTFANNMHTKSVAIGLPAVLVALYLFTVLADAQQRGRWKLPAGVLSSVMLAVLALSTETYLALAAPMLVVLAVGFALRQRTWRPIHWTAPFALAAAGVALVQGGVLTARGEVTTGGGAFRVSPDLFHISTFSGSVPIWSSAVLLEWLPLVALALPAAIVLGVRMRDPLTIAALCGASISLALPLLLQYPHSPPEMLRFLPVGASVLAALSSVTVVWMFGRFDRMWLRVPVVLAGASLLVGTVLFMTHGALYPLQFFGGLPRPDSTPGDGQGHPPLTESELEDIAALRDLPAGALVGAPPRTAAIQYSGRLPVLSGRDPNLIEDMEQVLRQGTIRGLERQLPVKYIFCDSAISSICQELDAKTRRRGDELVYERQGPGGSRAFILKVPRD